MTDPVFLALDEVLAIHADQLRRYGGATGVRDLGLLQSAIAMPQADFGGEYLHTTLYEKAGAYLFHVARKHPFMDGNKRTVLMCALVFLGSNGQRLRANPDELYELVDGVAAGRVDKADAAVFLRDHCEPR